MVSPSLPVSGQSIPLVGTILCWLLVGCVSVAQPTRAVTDDRAEPGPYAVEELRGEWKDSARKGRTILWKAYIPKDPKTSAPVVLYSHGGGGNRESNAMLGRHLASHGFAAFHLQHEGSDDKAVRADRKVLKAVNDPKASEDRYQDIAFAVKSLAAEARDGPVKGRINPDRVGIAGHSYGALTAQIVAGPARIEGGLLPQSVAAAVGVRRRANVVLENVDADVLPDGHGRPATRFGVQGGRPRRAVQQDQQRGSVAADSERSQPLHDVGPGEATSCRSTHSRNGRGSEFGSESRLHPGGGGRVLAVDAARGQGGAALSRRRRLQEIRRRTR
jgi:poly(3-hydroxybutyrate) depolymerase